MTSQELASQIASIHLEYMNNKVGMSHTHFEFWESGGSEGGNFYWFDDDGVTSVTHPDLEGLSWNDSLAKERPYRGRVYSLLKSARAQDKAAGQPPRNVYDMKVYRDGRHEFQFYHDAEHVAAELAEKEEAVLQDALEKRQQQEQWDALSKAEQQRIIAENKMNAPLDPDTLILYETRVNKIYKNADNLWHVEEFLRYQAAMVAPESWAEIRIEMKKIGEKKSAMDQWYRLEGEEKFHRLNGYSSMDVVDAIEHWRTKKDEGQHRNKDVRFIITPADMKKFTIRSEWI